MSRMRKMIMGLFGAGLGVFVLMVIVGNVAVDHSNPPVTYDRIQWDTPETEALMRHACYDCHSNETVWPWYSFVAPVSFLVSKDVQEGREELNFSTGHGELESHELIKQIEKNKMPLPVYLITHPEANLSEQQKLDLIAGIKASTFR